MRPRAWRAFAPRLIGASPRAMATISARNASSVSGGLACVGGGVGSLVIDAPLDPLLCDMEDRRGKRVFLVRVVRRVAPDRQAGTAGVAKENQRISPALRKKRGATRLSVA